MPSASELPPEIEQALLRDWVILTGNQRAARTLHHAYDLSQRARSQTAWQPPAIFAWETWTNILWNRLLLQDHVSHLLLSSTQEHSIWKTVIAADGATASLRPIEALAELAADAWKLLHDYHGRSRLQSFPGNTDTNAFARWVADFERRCQTAQYLTEAQLAETLRSHVDAGHLNLEEGFLLVGFDDKTPAQTALFDAVRATGAQIDEPAQSAASSVTAASSKVGEKTLTSTADEYAELAACAAWLRARLTQQSDARIAVIAPDIEADRHEIDRVFRNVLAPELNDVAASAASSPYEFSLGIPLARTPLAAVAFDILRWAAAPLPLDNVSALLLSPHFAAGHSADEQLARAEFDAFVLRRQRLLEPRISLDHLLGLAVLPPHNINLPVLIDRLRALGSFIRSRKLAGDHAHAHWAEVMHELLEAAGWAPLAQLDSIEFQTRRKWDEALDELASLDFDSASNGARIAFADALDTLARIAGKTLFAPESRHAPIQIMGPLESAGSTFDAVWFLRANDVAWPSPSAPNPLLAWQLQRSLAMPGANPILHSDRARRTTERIAAAAPEVVFSYARESADGPQRSSPVLAGLALEQRRTADLAPSAALPAPIALEAVADDAPIPAPPSSALQGGAGILQSQAACPFRAFAEKRLFSSAPDTVELGLDDRQRGNVVHRILQLFWSETQTQKNLLQMPRDERDQRLRRCIETALEKDYRRIDSGWPQAYLATERKRLFSLLNGWLDFERTRSPFAVQATEQELKNVSIGPLHINVRVDRIDLALGAEASGEPSPEIILDYKTGDVTPAKWIGERPDEPQLPLYAVVSQPAPIGAVAFANIRPGEKKPLKGYESRPGILPKAATPKIGTLDLQIEDWRSKLTALAEQFHNGDAGVSPKQYPSTCRYCEQRLLCRLDLAALEADANEDFAESSDSTVDSLEAPAEAERD